MADVLVQLRVLPEDITTNLTELQEKIKKVIPPGTRVHKVTEEDVAYGLKCLKVVVIMPDDLGGTDPVETAISSISDVQRVEVEIVSRM
jgi:elongation factor 1-beta